MTVIAECLGAEGRYMIGDIANVSLLSDTMKGAPLLVALETHSVLFTKVHF